MVRRTGGAVRGVGALALPLIVACASSTGPAAEPVCVSGDIVPLSAASCVVVASSVSTHPRGDEVLAWVTGSFGPASAALGLREVEIQLRAAGQRVIPEVGSGGFATDRSVELQVDLDTSYDPAFQRLWVEYLVAHELHHVARLRALGNPRSVGELVTFEGMADQFAMGFGSPPVSPWSSALQGDDLEAWVDRILREHPQRDYSVNAWLFGESPEIPRWAGYSAGFAISGDYLAQTGRTAAEATGDHADEIIDVVRAGG